MTEMEMLLAKMYKEFLTLSREGKQEVIKMAKEKYPSLAKALQEIADAEDIKK